jgi:dihydroflavonol-4-reductase
MRVLITGATGFVGSHAVVQALAAGHEVRALVRDRAKLERVLQRHGILIDHVVVGDMTDPSTVAEALDGCEGVVHTAAQIGVSAGGHQGHDSGVNAAGVQEVIGGAAAAGLDPVVYTSTTSAYWPSDAEVVTPDAPLGDLVGPYCESKRECEEIVRSLQADGAPVTTFVLGAVYGPDGPAVDGSADSLISMLGSMMLVTDGGLGVLDVRDIAGLAARALEPGRGPRHYMTGGPFLTWAGYVAATEEAAGRSIPVVEMEAEAVVAMGRDLDARRAAGEDVDIPLSEEAAAIMTSGRPTDDTATWAELGGTPHKTVDTLRAMLHTLIADGHLDPELAPAATAPPT